MDESQRREYWRSNLKLMATLLAVWFVVSYLFGILLVQPPPTRLALDPGEVEAWIAQALAIARYEEIARP